MIHHSMGSMNDLLPSGSPDASDGRGGWWHVTS